MNVLYWVVFQNWHIPPENLKCIKSNPISLKTKKRLVSDKTSISNYLTGLSFSFTKFKFKAIELHNLIVQELSAK